VDASFGNVIKQHLELKRRNSRLETAMPLERYRDPRMENHSLFAAEAPAERADTAPTEEWATREHQELFTEKPEDLWAGPPSFDWGE
jgi:hypothetical protein